jgi:glycerol-3-phosphate dehydrogenase (NAD(P)+)
MAVILHRLGRPVVLWGRDPAKIAELCASRRHPQLPGTVLPDGLDITADTDALSGCDLVFWAVPTQHTRAIARLLPLPAGVPVVSLSKGLEQETHLTVTGILAEQYGPRPYGALSGPSHAEEVMAGHPVVLAAAGPEALGRLLVDRLHGRACRLYTTTDLTGVELGGALKNVIAVAAGICEGLGLGDNLKAALITRGLAEIRRLGRAAGAQDATFAGMAGMGDLLTTCYSRHGRNRALGLAIASGEKPLAFVGRQQTVAEGAWTCRAAAALSARHGVDLPISSQVEAIIWREAPVKAALDALFARSPKEEDA